MTVAGVLLGTVIRNPMVASSGLAALSVVESLVSAAGDGPYLPFELVGGLMGVSDSIPAPAALAILLVYLAAFALLVRQWALPRDLT